MAGLPNNVSEAVRRLNPALYSGAQPEPVKIEAVKVGRKIIRVQKSRESCLNKTEARFLAYLRAEFPDGRIGIQDMTLRIGADCRYSPDFSLWTNHATPIQLFEVKGKHLHKPGAYATDDSIVKIKVAATAFPQFDFVIAFEDNGQWIMQNIPK